MTTEQQDTVDAAREGTANRGSLTRLCRIVSPEHSSSITGTVPETALEVLMTQRGKVVVRMSRSVGFVAALSLTPSDLASLSGAIATAQSRVEQDEERRRNAARMYAEGSITMDDMLAVLRGDA